MRPGLVAPLLLVAAGCLQLPPVVVNSSLQLTPAFTSTNPSNIAVVPIEDGSGSARDLTEPMRQELTQALIERRYAPISSRVIDPMVREQAAAVPVEASMTDPDVLARVAGRVREDATLAVRITAWDDSRVMSAARVRFTLAVTMLSARDKQLLWSGSLEGEIKAGGTGAAPRYRADRTLDAARQVARLLAEQLPQHVL